MTHDLPRRSDLLPPASPPIPAPASPCIAVVEERVTVGKSVEETGAVRVHVQVDRHEVPVTLEHVTEQVSVERVPIDRMVETRREPWQDGDVTVIPVYAEVEVVERRLVLVEEIRLHRHTRRTVTEELVPVQRQRAVVERRQPDGSWAGIGTDSDHDSVPPTG